MFRLLPGIFDIVSLQMRMNYGQTVTPFLDCNFKGRTLDRTGCGGMHGKSDANFQSSAE